MGGSFNILPRSEIAKTAFGDLRTAELHSQFQGSFEYTVDNSDLNDKVEVAGGDISQASGMAVVATSTTTGSSAFLSSKQHARYKAGFGGVSRFTVLFTEPVADTEQYIGLVDEAGSTAAFKNGYIVGYDGLTLGYHRFQNDTKITKAIADWDDPLDGSGASRATISPTNLNVFFIQYQYLGAGAIKIYFEKQDGTIVLVHTEKYAGLFSEPSTHNPNFHFGIHVNNKATSDNLTIKCASYAYLVEGRTSLIELHQPQNSSGTQEKLTVTAEVAILTIRNRATYASKNNFIDIQIEGVSASIEANSANNLANIRIVKDTLLGGTPVFSNINTNNSVVEIDTSGTTLTGGTEVVLPISLAGKNDTGFRDTVNLRLLLGSGETLTISGASVNSATIRAGISWRELF